MIAGEDRNDRQSLRTLLEAFCPEMQGRLVEVNDSVRLRGASPSNLRDRVSTLAKSIRARAAREDADIACVFVHEDFDRADGEDYPHVRERVQKALTEEFGAAHYVLAVWELEAWLLLFPDALTALVRSWSVPAKYHGRDTGMLSDPKQIMMREVSRDPRRYRESDAPAAFEKVIALGRVDHPAGTNRSWVDLREESRQCCATHIPTQRGQGGSR